MAHAVLIKLQNTALNLDGACGIGNLREAALVIEDVQHIVASKYVSAIKASARSSTKGCFEKTLMHIVSVAEANWITVSGTDGRRNNTLIIDVDRFLLASNENAKRVEGEERPGRRNTH